jgi:class 3 adenylate cyclase
MTRRFTVRLGIERFGRGTMRNQPEIRFALAAQEKFATVADSWKKRRIQLGLGIGVEAGYATLGRIGFEGRYDYGPFVPLVRQSEHTSMNNKAAAPVTVAVQARVVT